MPQVTLEDIALRHVKLSNRAERLRKAYFAAMPEVCVERPLLLTQYHLEHGLFGRERISILDKARAYRYVLERRRVVIWHEAARDHDRKIFRIGARSLFAGSTTSKFKGVLLYPEFLALALWPELKTISRRPANPYYLSEQEARILNEEVFPHWMNESILELAKKRRGHEANFRLLEKLVFFLASKPNCISHTIPDFQVALRSGLRELIHEARTKADATDDPGKREFYSAIQEAMEGIVSYSRRIAAKAESLASQVDDEEERRELLDLAKIHGRVPEYPATTFREALTTVWMCWVAVHLENPDVGMSLGRLDQVLWPYYERDIQRGLLTPDDAVDLLAQFWLKIGDHVPTVPRAGEQLFGGTGSNQAITIGGVDTKGRDAVNDLTYVILRSIELMKLRDPNLNARYMPGVNSRQYLERLCQANVTTRATPAIHNDAAVLRALTAKGDTLEQARDYGVVGCVEPCSAGRHYGHSGSLLVNLTSALELTLFNGRHRHTKLREVMSIETGPFEAFQTWAEFWEAFTKQVEWLAGEAVKVNNALGRTHQTHYPTPILSGLFIGPMDKGKDLIQGGAEINSSGVAIIGFADVVDSLAAIRYHVYENKEEKVSAAELLAALRDDFKGHAKLAAKLTNPDKTPKYGNEHPLAQEIAVDVVTLLDEVFGRHENYRGGRYRVGYWTMTNHAGFGRISSAMPNGRRTGENFASGVTPVSGATPQLLPVLHSVADLPAERIMNGMALNIKFTPEKADPPLDHPFVKRFADSVEAYFDPEGVLTRSRNGSNPRGNGSPNGAVVPEGTRLGMEIQFNITDHDTFVDAVKHPERHRELLVRVSGYTAYFIDLNLQMQKEIIERTEYELESGNMVRYETFEIPGLLRKKE